MSAHPLGGPRTGERLVGEPLFVREHAVDRAVGVRQADGRVPDGERAGGRLPAPAHVVIRRALPEVIDEHHQQRTSPAFEATQAYISPSARLTGANVSPRPHATRAGAVPGFQHHSVPVASAQILAVPERQGRHTGELRRPHHRRRDRVAPIGIEPNVVQQRTSSPTAAHASRPFADSATRRASPSPSGTSTGVPRRACRSSMLALVPPSVTFTSPPVSPSSAPCHHRSPHTYVVHPRRRVRSVVARRPRAAARGFRPQRVRPYPRRAARLRCRPSTPRSAPRSPRRRAHGRRRAAPRPAGTAPEAPKAEGPGGSGGVAIASGSPRTTSGSPAGAAYGTPPGARDAGRGSPPHAASTMQSTVTILPPIMSHRA